MTTAGARGARSAEVLELLADGTPVVVEAADVVVGRTAASTVRVVHPLVSREHCRITLAADAVTVEDLGSINGTFVNDQRLTARTKLAAGDRIGLGREGAVLVVVRAIVGGRDVSRIGREEDVETLHAGDARAAGVEARIEVAAHALPVASAETRDASVVPVLSALQTTEIPRPVAEPTPVASAPAPAATGFLPGLAAGFLIGLALVGATAKFTHLLDGLRPTRTEVPR